MGNSRRVNNKKSKIKLRTKTRMQRQKRLRVEPYSSKRCQVVPTSPSLGDQRHMSAQEHRDAQSRGSHRRDGSGRLPAAVGKSKSSRILRLRSARSASARK